MSQVSYGTITIVDTTDIARIYMVYAKSVSNTTPPSDELTWSESIASAPGEGDFIWQKTVVEKAITEEKTYSDPVCVTGSSGQGVEKIINYYCNYGQGQPEEDYSGWQLEIPEYDENKPNYWTKVVVIYSDDTRKDFQASGTIATFESEKAGIFDSLEVNLSPIQDLHGYDKPWVGGAGKNKLDDSIVSSLRNLTYQSGVATEIEADSRNSVVFVLQAYNNGTYVRNLGTSYGNTQQLLFTKDSTFNQISFGNSGSTKDAKLRFDVSNLPDGEYKWCFTPINYTTHPFSWKDMMIVESSVTDYSYTPYSNICPISGWDSVDTHKTGVNVWDEEWEAGYYNITTGEPATSSQNLRSKNFIPVVPNTSYYVKIPTGYIAICEYDADKNFIKCTQGIVNRGITTTADTHFIRFHCTSAYGTTYNNDISINYPSTDHDYHAYQGQTYTATLPQTVYGGTLDVVNGTLTVDRAMVDLGTLNWIYDSTNERFYTYGVEDAKNYFNAVCSNYPFVGGYSNLVDKSVAYIYYNKVCIKDLDYADATAFKTAMNGVQLCYELATPTSYSLTPQEVQTLLGRNNVWSDGTVELRGHTISKRDVMIYKDNGLTDVVNKSAEANTNAAEALEKANDGIVSTTQLWYQTNSTSAPSVPASHSQVDQGTITYNNWRSARPNNNVDSYKYYYYCYEYLHGDGTYTYSTEAILDTSNLSQYQIDQLQTRVKKIWSNSTGSYMASGIGTNEVDIDDSSTYGFNSKSTTTGVSFNYNTISLTSLGTDGVNLYSPTLTNGVITGSRLDATLSTNGLILNKGGIKAREGYSDFIYLSTDPYGSYSINGSTGISDWKQIIGTKFGVRADGTLYANSVNIQGILTAGAGSTIGPWSITATSIYKGSATHGAAGNGNMYFGNDGLSISNTFKVSSAGVLSAAGAQISGNITANSLIIEEGASIGGLNTDHIDNFQETIDLIDNKIIKNASYIYASDPEDTSTYSETNTQLQYQALKLVSSEESLIWELNPVWASGVADNYITTISGSGGISIRNENEPGSYMELEPHIMNFYDNNSVQASIGNIPDEHIYGIIAEALNAYGSGAGVKFDNAKNNSEDEVRGRFIWVIRDNGHLSLKKY